MSLGKEKLLVVKSEVGAAETEACFFDVVLSLASREKNCTSFTAHKLSSQTGVTRPTGTAFEGNDPRFPITLLLSNLKYLVDDKVT